MPVLKSDDDILDKQADIEQHLLTYYNSLYASENVCSNSVFVNKVIPNLVSNEDNAMLTNLPTLEEAKAAVFDMSGSGALGPDGFGGSFFQKFWDNISDDVFQFVLQFFYIRLDSPKFKFQSCPSQFPIEDYNKGDC